MSVLPAKSTRSHAEPDSATTVRASTLRDVAGRAGVSAATVSVVLNNTRSGTRVSADTRSRILTAAKELRYRPNAAARGMKRQRMDTIGVLSTIDGSELNLYFMELLNGILDAASKQGHNTTVFSVSDWQGDEERILGFCDGRVDGMILIGPSLTKEFAGLLRESIPYVTIHSASEQPSVWNLDVDNEAGAYQITRYLIEQGHRHIAHVSGPIGRPVPEQRIAGYRRALAEAGIEFDPANLIPAAFTVDAGKECTAEWLRRTPQDQMPSAIFCSSDAIAVGCLEALAEHGLRAPDQISVVGFDDTLAAQMTSPRLTTVRQPFHAMGRNAVELLLEAIQGKDATIPARESPLLRCFPVDLIVRGTVGPVAMAPPTPQ